MQDKSFIFALTVALGLTLFLSFATSAYGLWEMLASQHGGENSILTGVWGLFVLGGAAVLISAVVQTLIGGFWSYAAAPGNLIGVRIIGLIFGAVMSLVSAGFATAFYTLVLPVADEIRVLKNDRAFIGVAEPVIAFSGMMNEISAGMTALSSAMETAKTLEVKGRSCDGPRVRPGQGPRWRMRVELAAKSKAHAAAAAALAKDAMQAATLPQNVNDAAMREAFQKARKLSVDSRFLTMKTWVGSTLEDFRGGFTDAKTNKAFACRDATVEAELKKFLGLLNRPLNLPAIPPRAAKFEFSESLRNSYSGIFGSLAGVLGIEGLADDQAFDKTKPALMIALLVEGIIVALIFVRVWIRDPGTGGSGPGGMRSAKSGRRRRGVALEPGLAAELSAKAIVYTALLERIGPNRTVLMVPKDGDLTLLGLCLEEIDGWSMRLMPGGINVDLRTEAPARYSRLREPSGGARTYDVYEVPRAALRWWRQVRLDLAETRVQAAAASAAAAGATQ